MNDRVDIGLLPVDIRMHSPFAGGRELILRDLAIETHGDDVFR
jgi:hypothetical protein